MGKGEQLSVGSGFRSVAMQRRVVCITLLAALLPVVITRSYLYYAKSVVPSEATRFFQEHPQPAPAAPPDEPSREVIPQFTEAISNSSDQAQPGIRNEDPETKSPTPLTGTSPTSLNASASGPSSAVEVEAGNGKNASASSHSEGSKESNDLLQESFDNSTREVEEPTKADKAGEIVMEGTPAPSTAQANPSHVLTSEGVCNLEQGSWVPDSRPPLYNSTTCKYIQGLQNCHKNGRPDDGYLYWKWKPDRCELPRIDAAAFLTAMRNRSVVFAGDSIARNQFQSLLCVLSQVDDPKHTFWSEDGRNNVHHFRSFNFTLSVRWSPYLVRMEEVPTTWPDNTTETVRHVYVDELDDMWVQAAAGADVVQLSTGQWWYKYARYIENKTSLGCHGHPACDKEIGFADPYYKAIANALRGSLAIPGFSGTTVYRSFSPEHFENGNWDTGGDCVRTAPGGLPMSHNTEWMYRMQRKSYKHVSEALGTVAKDRLKLLGVTDLAQIRADGHPNKYRTEWQKENEKRGNVVPNDCLHWCLPGPIDTWNDLLVHSLHDVIFR